jgi:hypothetical protein
MSTYHNLLSVSDSTATEIIAADNSSGRDITIQNINGAGYIYIGGAGVTEANYGFRLSSNQAISFELASQDGLYAIASDADMKVAILSVNLESED